MNSELEQLETMLKIANNHSVGYEVLLTAFKEMLVSKISPLAALHLAMAEWGY